MGEAGWGCPGADQQFRGCKWSAQAGLVLQLPIHGSSQGRCAGGGGASAAGGGGGGGAEESVPVHLFRSWALQLQLEGRRQAARGVQRCDWAAYGFQLVGGAAGVSLGDAGTVVGQVVGCLLCVWTL